MSLHRIGATKMAHLLTNPELVDFTEVLRAGEATVDVMRIAIAADSPHCNRTLADSSFRSRGVMVVAIHRRDGKLLILPTGASSIRPGDTLTVLGPELALEQVLAEA